MTDRPEGIIQSRENHQMRWDDQALNATGEWWIHDRADAVPGFLEEVPGRGLVLTVMGDISELRPGEPIPEVVGSAFSGVVLMHVVLMEERSSGKARRQEFSVQSALLGAQTSPSSLAVTAGQVSFTGHRSWWPGSAFHIEYEDLSVVKATYTRPAVESAAVPGGSIALGVRERTHAGIGEIGIQAIPSFYVDLDEPVPYNEFLAEWISPLRDLNSLVTSHPSAIVHLKVLPTDHDGLLVDVRGDPVERNSVAQPPAATALDLGQMRPREEAGLKLPPVSGLSFHQLLENWWRFRAKQRLALDQYFATSYSSPPPESVHLLNHLVVLETFHQHKFPGAVREPWDEFNQRKRRILNPERWDRLDDDRAWLEAQHWELMNLVTLKSRLTSLSEHTTALDKVVVDWNRCCGQFAATRNYLAHGSAELASRAIPPSEYEACTRLLDSWIRALFWSELGFDDSMVECMLRSVESFDWLRSNIKRTWIRSDPEDLL